MISPTRMPSCFKSFANLLSLLGGGINGDIESGFRIAPSPLTNRFSFRLSNRLGRYGMLRRRWWGNTFRGWRDWFLEGYDSIASYWFAYLRHEGTPAYPEDRSGNPTASSKFQEPLVSERRGGDSQRHSRFWSPLELLSVAYIKMTLGPLDHSFVSKGGFQ
jgi:hypothetical protein